MKKFILTGIFAIYSVIQLNAQPADDHSAVKLYISEYTISVENYNLPANLQSRLYRKMTQLINQTGIAEIGYSTFLVSPKFDVVSSSVSQAGITKVYLAECDLSIAIKRTTVGNSGEAVFNSFSKTITGSGSNKDEAIANAVTGISAGDKDVVKFLSDSKAKIDAYFQAHCKDVIKEAERALALKNYAESIALYFSVPSNAPCYEDAFNASQKVYATYVADICSKNLVKLKAYVALAQTQNTGSKNYYDSAMSIMSNLNPSSDRCYIESLNEIEKIEKRLGEEQKKQWEFLKKLSTDGAEVKKEMYKAMGRISSNYQPGAATNVIIAH